MKRTLSFILAFALLLVLFLPSADAADSSVGDLTLSQHCFAPSENGRLYIYLPVLSGKVDCTLTVYDALGRAVARFERSGLKKNIHTFIWNCKPSAGNDALLDSAAFVPDGSYTVEAVCTGSGAAEYRMVSIIISSDGETLRPETGIPNYSGDHELDYLITCVLEELPLTGLTTVEKVKAVYTWVQANFYRRGEKGDPWYDLEALAPRIKREGAYNDSLHDAGQINYNVLGNLYISNAKSFCSTGSARAGSFPLWCRCCLPVWA